MEDHLIYRNQLIKQISTLQSVDVDMLQRQLDVAQNDLVYVLQTITEQLKTELLRNPTVNTKELRQLLQPFEFALRGETQPEERDRTYDTVILQGIDSLDHLRQQAEASELSVEHIAEEIQQYLNALQAVDIEEIALVGEPFDTKYMFLEKQVPVTEVPDIEVGKICEVLERGFVNVKTGAVLRKATVCVAVDAAVTTDELADEADTEQ